MSEHNAIAVFWQELRRRKVVRVAVAYLVAGWVLIQVADATLEPLHLPPWAGTLVVWLIALGFPVAVILAWVLDVTPAGIKVTQSAGPTPASQAASIAVLPFVNLSRESDDEYFSDGLSEELINVLVRLQSLQVCSRTSSFTFKGKDVAIPVIARQLGVRHLLEGSVRRSGKNIRITAQLIDAEQDRHLWSQTFDRELTDIFAVQDEIAARILKSLKVTLTIPEEHALKSTTESVEALDCYLRGREHYHRSEPGHLLLARQQFEEAIAVDPAYAQAWAGLTYVFVDTYWYVDKDSKWLERAEESSRKAVELAPHLAESHTARGLAFRVAEKFEEAAAEFEKSISINPNLFEPLHFYAQMMRGVREYQRAAELFLQAAEVRPEDYQALALAQNMFEALGNKERALQAARETRARVARAIELDPNDSRALVLGATALQLLGDLPAALQWAERAQEADPRSNGVYYNTACIYAKAGEVEHALDLLEKAVALGARNKRYYETDSDFESLRDHPRFKALLERI